MILVTGATGFIGRQFIQELCKTADRKDILCLVYEKCDNELERSGRKVLDDLNIAYIPVDLVTGKGMEAIPKSPDLVFHLASITITASRDHRVNDLGTKNLLHHIQPVKPGMNFIYASTICVSDRREDFSKPISESSPVPDRPANLYGRKKLIAENYLRQAAAEQNFSLNVVRVCGVYGAGVRVNGLFDSIEKLVKKGSILSRLNWPGKISIINVKNMAEFFLGLSKINAPAAKSNLYIPSVEALSLSEMCETVYAASGKKYKPVRLPGFFWGMCRLMARNKHIIEYFLPHQLYDRVWQFSILVNNEFWNESEKIRSVIPNWAPITYRIYYQKKKDSAN